MFFCTRLIDDRLRDFEDFLAFFGFLTTERLLDATVFFCTHLIDDRLRDFEDFLAFFGLLITERLLDATLFFCTRLIDDLLRDFEDFLAFVGFLITERLLDAILFFCTHPAFLDNDLLFLAVLCIIEAFLIIRRPLFFKEFEKTAVFLNEDLLHMFFLIVPRDFNIGTFEVFLHLLFTLFTILVVEAGWLFVFMNCINISIAISVL